MNRSAVGLVPLIVLLHVPAATALQGGTESTPSVALVQEQPPAQNSPEIPKEIPDPVAEKAEKQKSSHRLRSVLFGDGGVAAGGVPISVFGGGAALEYLAHRYVLVGGYAQVGVVGPAPPVVSLDAGPLLRLRIPFGKSRVAWLMTLQGGVGGDLGVPSNSGGSKVGGVLRYTLIGLESFFTEHVGMTFHLASPRLFFDDGFVALQLTMLQLGFSYAW